MTSAIAVESDAERGTLRRVLRVVAGVVVVRAAIAAVRRV
jgi:hypothetical protein